jgi:hypothetical protein
MAYPAISGRIECGTADEMTLKKITRADKKIVESYLSNMPRQLCVYSFAQIAIWEKLYSIEWTRIEGALFIFFKDSLGCFMNCEPLGKAVTAGAVAEAFRIMDGCNKNKAYSRIENVEERRVEFYRSLGYEAAAKGGDYVYERARLARLRGDSYKSKRASCNFFEKNYDSRYLPYTRRYSQACLDLYDAWALGRMETAGDRVYAGMLRDSRYCLQAALNKPSELGLRGRMILIDGVVKAFTFGYELNEDTFCILYEIADLAVKGISQYIFRQICIEEDEYRYINAMDDSGIARIQSVKRSYRPNTIVPAYIIQRPHAQGY